MTSTDPRQPETEDPEPRAITVSIDDRDRLRWLSWLTVVGVAIAGLFAVIGGFPFDNPMPTHSFGVVEPSCGLTRGSTAIARGDFALAWRYNPASFLVMGLGVAGLVRFVLGVTTHRWLNIRLALARRQWTVAGLTVLALVAVLWAYQQTNAEFIINSRA